MKPLLNKSGLCKYASPFLIFLFFIPGISAIAQTNPKVLEDNARNIIDKYYSDEDFTVSVNDQDVLTLSGTVNTLYDKLKLQELIARIPGIKKINSEVDITSSLLPDKEIETNILDEIKYNRSILEPEKIKVAAHNGVVTLSGEVNYYPEKLMVQSIASWQDGVKDMISNIKVLPPAIAKSDENLYEIITDELKDNFPLEKDVVVEVKNGSVTISGAVKNLWLKNQIEDSIHHIVGVNSVLNNLIIITA